MTALLLQADVSPMHIDLIQVFMGSPTIYTILLILSITAVSLWVYALLTLKQSHMMPQQFLNQLRELVAERRFDAALTACQQENNFMANVIGSALAVRKHGAQVMLETLQAEGKRLGLTLWQRIALLNEIALVSPMLGLLGTVIGLFVAFYGMQRSAESLAAIFDGFGMALGTTVAGLVVAIMSLIFYSTVKFRLVYLLNVIENESSALLSQIEHESHR